MTTATATPAAGLPVEIGPNTRRNPALAAIVALPGLLALLLAADLVAETRGREPLPVLIVVGIAALFFLLGACLWRSGSLARGRLRLDAAGVTLHSTRPFRRDLGPIRLAWDEIAAIRHVSFRATQQAIGLVLTHDGALAQGRVLPTTRRDRGFLTRQTIWLSGHAFELPHEALIGALLDGARAAGCQVEDRGGEYLVATNRRWDLSPPPH